MIAGNADDLVLNHREGGETNMEYFIRLELPDFLIEAIQEQLRGFMVNHAMREIELNEAIIDRTRQSSFTVRRLPDTASRDNFSEVTLSIPLLIAPAKWKKVQYPRV